MRSKDRCYEFGAANACLPCKRKAKERFLATLGMTGGDEESGLTAGLNAWKQKIVAFAGGLGAPGLFLISFLDSSVLTFPVINDL